MVEDAIVSAVKRYLAVLPTVGIHANRAVLFGSFARGDYGIRSDLDLLIVLQNSDEVALERIERFLGDAPVYPTDMLVYTDEELRARFSGGDAFIAQVLRESIQIWPEGN